MVHGMGGDSHSAYNLVWKVQSSVECVFDLFSDMPPGGGGERTAIC